MKGVGKKGRVYPAVSKGCIVRDDKEGIVRFNPPLKRRADDWGDFSIPGKNIGAYFTYLFAAAYDGVPATNGNGGFCPDIERHTVFGDVLTEVKGVSTNGSRPFCSVRQLLGYGAEILLRAEEGQQIPFADYAIFRYGNRRTRSANLSVRQLAARLPRMGRDLIIVPQNMMYALALVSPEKTINQFSSGSSFNERVYRMIYGTNISSLHSEPKEMLDWVGKELALLDLEGMSADNFLIDNLSFGRSDFPSNIRVWGHSVKPFPVLRFDLREPHAWMQVLSENRDYFAKALGVYNLESIFDNRRTEREERAVEIAERGALQASEKELALASIGREEHGEDGRDIPF